VLATLGYAPYGQWYLSLLALALLFTLAAGATPRRAALLGWLYGFAHFLTGVYWVYISTHIYGGAPAWLGALLLLALSAYLALYPALVLAIAARLNLFHSASGWLGLPALWLLLELVRGWFYSGFPWLSLGELSLGTPLSRFAPLIGVHGISALIALLAYALFRIGVEPDTRRRALAAAVLAAPVLTLLLPTPSAWTEADGESIPVALVQSNIKQDEKWKPPMRYEALLRHWRLTQQAWPARLVVWPEVALTQPYHQLRDSYLASLDGQAKERDAAILLGILVFDDKAHYNSVITVGRAQGRYDKRHLVPFGEYFPIPDFLRPLMDVLETPYSDFHFGKDDQPLLRLNGHALEISICFEDVFGDEIRRRAREAAYLVNVTNDAWFGNSSAPHQHLQFSRLRAMENARWMLRSANTGISALIDPDGRVVERSEQFREQVLRGEVEPRRGTTPYQRWGDLPLWILASATLAAVLAYRWRLSRRTAAEAAAP
jgi:apolipoprotein N-acyltransferase